jgi:hypothetical protein
MVILKIEENIESLSLTVVSNISTNYVLQLVNYLKTQKKKE